MALLVLKVQALLKLRNAFPMPRWGGLRDKPREPLLGVSRRSDSRAREEKFTKK